MFKVQKISLKASEHIFSVHGGVFWVKSPQKAKISSTIFFKAKFYQILRKLYFQWKISSKNDNTSPIQLNDLKYTFYTSEQQIPPSCTLFQIQLNMICGIRNRNHTLQAPDYHRRRNHSCIPIKTDHKVQLTRRLLILLQK